MITKTKHVPVTFRLSPFSLQEKKQAGTRTKPEASAEAAIESAKKAAVENVVPKVDGVAVSIDRHDFSPDQFYSLLSILKTDSVELKCDFDHTGLVVFRPRRKNR